MNDSYYYQLADALFASIEQKLDDFSQDHEIDYESQGNVIAISFENGSKIVINRQPSLHQIWMATRKNGYHFQFINDYWICNRTQKHFWQTLENALLKQIH